MFTGATESERTWRNLENSFWKRVNKLTLMARVSCQASGFTLCRCDLRDTISRLVHYLC